MLPAAGSLYLSMTLVCRVGAQVHQALAASVGRSSPMSHQKLRCCWRWSTSPLRSTGHGGGPRREHRAWSSSRPSVSVHSFIHPKHAFQSVD